MHTVSELAELANVTVRTLHHYDEIGLVVPSARSDAGYRLYAPADMERLQLVLFYRELGFGLAQIKELLDRPDFDRGQALRDQRELLTDRAGQLTRMIHAVDRALAAYEEGLTMTEKDMFDVFGDDQRELQEEAKQRWGDTDPYRESQARLAHYTKADWEELRVESEAILQHIADVYRSGASADSVDAMDAVEAHRLQISRRFYECSHQMQVQLAEGYVTDARFAATYEALASGLAVWVRDAIRANAARVAA